MNKSDKITCEKCGSDQISANKKGYSVGKAAAGVILTGGIGLIAGAHGSGNIVITCLKCGNKWNPKKEAERTKSLDLQRAAIATKSFNDWKNQFMTFYNEGKLDAAENMHNEKFGKDCSLSFQRRYELYKKVERDNKKFLIVSGIVLAILVIVVVWYII